MRSAAPRGRDKAGTMLKVADKEITGSGNESMACKIEEVD